MTFLVFVISLCLPSISQALDDDYFPQSTTVADVINNSGLLNEFDNFFYSFPFNNCKILRDNGRSILVLTQSANPVFPIIELALATGTEINMSPVDFNRVAVIIGNGGGNPNLHNGMQATTRSNDYLQAQKKHPAKYGKYYS